MRRLRCSNNRSEDQDTLINLTPLIDVVFVVLIMFIIVAPLVELEHVELATSGPGTDTHSTLSNTQLFLDIHVRKDNTVLYNNHIVALQELLPILTAARQHHPNRTLRVFHDRKAYFETYQTIKNTAERAGFESMDLVLKGS